MPTKEIEEGNLRKRAKYLNTCKDALWHRRNEYVRALCEGHDLRSPDLTSCDFFLLGYLKSKVYICPPVDLNDLQACIRQEVGLLANDPAMVRQAVQDILRCCQTCIDRNTGHVEGIGA